MMDTFLNTLRINMSFAVLAFSTTTAAAQGLGLTYSIAQLGEGKPGVGEQYVARGFALSSRSAPGPEPPQSWWKRPVPRTTC